MDTPSRPASPRRLRHVLLFAGCGIVLPGAALAMKEMCAEEFFDPAPTWFHVALLLLVPLHHALVLAVPEPRQVARHLDLLGGVVLGISFVYALVFAPLVPLAVVAIMFAGLGLLPLAPLGALCAAIVAQRRMLAAQAPSGTRRRLRTGASIALGIALLVGAEARGVLAEYGAREASSDDPLRAVRGAALLRHWGLEESVARAGQQQRGFSLALLPGDELDFEARRRAYYRTTGKRLADDTRWASDPDLGGAQIGDHSSHVRLVGSRLDGSVDGEAALGYVEWTLVFHNDDTVQAEARGQVALPHGGVVSRARLWIDGEPREAAFGGAADVRRAYEGVVRQARDPLLVTHVAPDLAQFQCFPIAPGGDMKIALGITFPLDVERPERAQFALPELQAANFVAEGARLVWFEAKTMLAHAGRDGTCAQGGPCTLTFEGSDSGAIRVRRTGLVTSWATHKGAPPSLRVGQALQPRAAERPERLAIVVDTSRSMAGSFAAIARALVHARDLPAVRVALATDDGVRWLERPDAIARELGAIDAVGGVDDLPALREAALWVRGAAHGRVLWLHGDAPVALGNPEPLFALFERGGLALTHAQVAKGEHVLLAALGSPPGLEALPRFGSLEGDLTQQLARWSGAQPAWHALRAELAPNDVASGHATSDHLLRLWARDEVERLRPAHRDQAVALAIAHQLVTPVSGAVVLATRAEYEAAGLAAPANLDGVPSVPEPETWALCFLALGGLAVHTLRMRRAEAS